MEIGSADDETLPWPPSTRLRPREGGLPLSPTPVYAATFERRWSVSSYSALVRDAGGPGVPRPGRAPDAPHDRSHDTLRETFHGVPHDAPQDALHHALPDASAARPLRDDEPDILPSPGTSAAALPERPDERVSAEPWHRVPRGAHAGDFLHDQLEWLAGEGFALDTSAELQQRLAHRCAQQGWGAQADDVVHWLRAVCNRPLPTIGAPLSALGTLVPEMEFWFPSDGLSCGTLDALCRDHLFPGRPRPALVPRTLQGMLMGFVDLVFEHGGRHWVLDHKSNALGRQDHDYTATAMEAAMLEHRYDVQAALYLLALHRLLRARLGPAYRPAHHLGGAVYLFLRGVQGPMNGCCTLPASLALVEALDALVPQA